MKGLRQRGRTVVWEGSHGQTVACGFIDKDEAQSWYRALLTGDQFATESALRIERQQQQAREAMA